jgi:pimeloyl-ACP methyl ester carboxylesterase
LTADALAEKYDGGIPPTYLLVHGGWSGAWCWPSLEREFDRRGIKWIAVDLPSSKSGADPSTNLANDAAAVAATVRSDGRYVLVGHSYGGAVITEVAPRIPNLERVVYIAGLVPNKGQSSTDAARTIKTRTMLDEAIEVDGEYLRLNPHLAFAALYSDCPPVVATRAVSKLSTQTLASFRSPRSSDNVDAPSLYIRCTLDQAIDPQLQELMADRCDVVFDLDSDHSPFLSQPSNLCDAILS